MCMNRNLSLMRVSNRIIPPSEHYVARGGRYECAEARLCARLDARRHAGIPWGLWTNASGRRLHERMRTCANAWQRDCADVRIGCACICPPRKGGASHDGLGVRVSTTFPLFPNEKFARDLPHPCQVHTKSMSHRRDGPTSLLLYA